MPTSCADIWNDLPADLRDRIGDAEPMTDSEWSRAIRLGVPATTDGRTGWRLPTSFAARLAAELDHEAGTADDAERARRLQERAARVRSRL